MTENTYDKMELRTTYNATINGYPAKIYKPDSGGIVDFDHPTREYKIESIVLGKKINQ